MIAFRALALLFAATVVAATVLSAIRTLVVPRALPVALTRAVFLVMRRLFGLFVRVDDFAVVDRRMAYYAPITLLLLPVVWLSIVLAAYTAVYWALGADPGEAFSTSGAALFTLEAAPERQLDARAASFTEAGLGVGLIAMLITYLPTMYGAFRRREALVAMLEVRAGQPAWAITMIERYQAIGSLDKSDELWRRAEEWFADVEESHTSLPALLFFRSRHPEQSWVTASAAILDGAALTLSAVDVPHQPDAALCIRAGYVSLRRIADYFGISYDSDPRSDDPISITRDEFDDALDRLAAAGVPLRADRDRAWRDFAGWRVNYDAVLLNLAFVCLAPYAPWSSDRSLPHRTPLFHRRWRRRTTTR